MKQSNLRPDWPKTLPKARLTEADLRFFDKLRRAAVRSLRYDTAEMRQKVMEKLARRINRMYPAKKKSHGNPVS